MSWIGVITGDIVDSTRILEAGGREKLLATLKNTIADINADEKLGKVTMEIYRGDSFQCIVEYPKSSLYIAILIRASLISHSEGDIRWDARMGIGVGKGEFIAEKVTESDGEAFRLSGQAFDNLGRNHRIAILTPDEDFNKELRVSTAFADDIMSGWTATQASVIYPFWLNPLLSQKDIAEQINKSPQAVNKLLITSRFSLIFGYVNRYMSKTIKLELLKINLNYGLDNLT
ncbi:hypothetical protein M2132_000858 [Dysgonomonas sp. PH5-45]|uniref:SatD family protein n=1 Tax=unclassified Dysgonomonas TaxID=2630389 RepID=UPI002473EC67|nr:MULTISPECIES: SatD family protein [unclassified Dysgonomonas]MDH6354530.1 hypothetical protein [Dysgonomonas sp. PH5-45]MDH6387414.1 hypothetical protein [Dysgonomonas sp. PH5-37]